MSKLDLLKPKVKKLAERLLAECKKAKLDLVITQTFRSASEQDQLYALGRSQPGKIVTNAKGGYSLHNYGLAFDFCPVVSKKAAWDNLALFKQIGVIATQLGLEWGGNWANFPDRPHLQYTAGYSIDDFVNNRVEWHKFEL